MKRINLLRIVGCNLIMFTLVSIAIGQEIRSSEAAYNAWKSGDGLELATGGQCRVVFSFASQIMASGKLTADITVAVTGSLTQLPALGFTVQPLSVLKNAGGEASITELGSPSIVDFPGRNPATPVSGVIAKPMITAPIPEGANAVRISVKGFSGDNAISSVLSLKESPTSSVIASPVCGN